MQRKHSFERDQIERFGLGDLAPRKARELMACPFFSIATTMCICAVDFRAGAISIPVKAARQILHRQSLPGYRPVLTRDPNGRGAAELSTCRSIRSAGESRKRPSAYSGALRCHRQEGCTVRIASEPGDQKFSQLRNVS
jgi:hypothetical protein